MGLCGNKNPEKPSDCGGKEPCKGPKATKVPGMKAEDADASIKKAIKDQRKMLEAKKKELETWDDKAKAKFKKAFGKDDDKSRDKIQARINKMLEVNKSMTVANFKAADPKEAKELTNGHPEELFAYVNPTDKTHTVSLGEAFANAPATGQDSHAGVLCHEMSHSSDIGGTKDKFIDANGGKPIYGLKASRQLAVDHPDLALNHADSFEYYVEDVP
jgi:alanyl-tRNA synthetase